MDLLDNWRFISPIVLLALERGYALWRRSRPNLPHAPLSRLVRRTGRVIGEYASHAIISATKDLKLESQALQLEAQQAQIEAQRVLIEGMRARLTSVASEGGSFDLPIGTPPTSGERRTNPHERRKTRAATPPIGGIVRA